MDSNIVMYKKIFDINLEALAVIKFDDLSECTHETKKRIGIEEQYRINNVVDSYCDLVKSYGKKIFNS